jgi:hypothetical protein
LASVLARQFTYVVGDVEEDLIASQRNGVLLAVMGRQQSSKDILGGPKRFIEKE